MKPAALDVFLLFLTPLLPAQGPSPDVLRALLDSGARTENPRVVSVLLAAGADARVRTGGETALSLALKNPRLRDTDVLGSLSQVPQ